MPKKTSDMTAIVNSFLKYIFRIFMIIPFPSRKHFLTAEQHVSEHATHSEISKLCSSASCLRSIELLIVYHSIMNMSIFCLHKFQNRILYNIYNKKKSPHSHGVRGLKKRGKIRFRARKSQPHGQALRTLRYRPELLDCR